MGAPRSVAVLAAAAILVIAACGASPEPERPTRPGLPAVLAFRCGDVAIPLEALGNPVGAENADVPAGRALKRFLEVREPGDVRPAPISRTFRVVTAAEDSVVFVSDGMDGTGMFPVVAERNGDAWTAHGIQPCAPKLDLHGLHSATWQLPALAAPPGGATRRITALVSETDCVSGRSAGDRVLPPAIVWRREEVLLVFAVMPPPTVGFEACPAAPPTEVEVDLGAPLGDRELFDGSVYPPSPAWQGGQPACCG